MARNSLLAHSYTVILAGGSGTRFWPASRQRRPKHLLEDIFGPETLLQRTVERISPLIPFERTYVFTNKLLKKRISKLLPKIPKQQIIAEPAARNTAPTLGLAAHEILRRDPEGIMVVLPSDHLITKPAAFRRAIRVAIRTASTAGRSVLIGMKPTSAHTGYGYIRKGQETSEGGAGHQVFKADGFAEKPSAAVAARYLASGEFLWNGGMFVWRASTLIGNLERFKPAMARSLARIDAQGGARSASALGRIYPKLEKVSVDYAVAEHADEVYVIPADIGWSDVGSWSEAYALASKDAEGNARPARSLSFASRRNLIMAGKFVAAVGVEDLILIETPDAILVASRRHAQDVGKAVAEMERQGWKKLL